MAHDSRAASIPPPRAAQPRRHTGSGKGRWRDDLNSHPLLIGFASLLWLILRTGRKPSRIGYPCQQAALSGASLAYLVTLAPLLCPVARWTWRRKSRVAAAAALVAALALGGMSDSSLGQSRTARLAQVPADYVADVYVVRHSGGPAGDRHLGVDELIAGMGAAGLKFYRSAVGTAEAGPDGLVRANDVVVIKVNSQWPERGGTNTDVLKGLITRILEHPDGFHGEVVVADNGQGAGSLNWSASNAEDHGQSVLDVVQLFVSRGQPVSAYLWDGIRGTAVAEYGDGDRRDGYVVGPWDAAAQLKVSYPKFRTAGGHHVSLKYGIWDSVASVYDATRLRFLNLPVLKCHATYGVTAATKHHVGTMTTALGANTHWAVPYGGIGTFLAQVRMPDLNILDCIYVLADPNKGPACLYTDATRTDKLVASRDPVALDLWAVTNILVPTMVANGHTVYHAQDPADTNSDFRRYLDRTAARLVGAGIAVTNDPGRIIVHGCDATSVDGGTSMHVGGPYPNPFASTTRIRFIAGRTGTARLDVYDLSGRIRRSILVSVQHGAAHEIQWDGADQDGRPVSAGTYYYRLTGAGAPAAGKVTRVR